VGFNDLDPERRDSKGQIFWVDLCNDAQTVNPRLLIAGQAGWSNVEMEFSPHVSRF